MNKRGVVFTTILLLSLIIVAAIGVYVTVSESVLFGPRGGFDFGNTRARQCVPGWICLDEYSRAYQTSSCSYSLIGECGDNEICEDGECLECVSPPQGMVSWWDGDDTSGQGGITHFVNDIWDGNDGEVFNGATITPGIVGSAVSFDGIDDEILVPDSDNLDVTSITIDAWVKPESFGAPYIVVRKYSSSDAAYGMEIDELGHALCIFKFQNGESHSLTGNNALLDENEWNHVTCSYDEIDAVGRLYKNGEEVASFEPASDNLPLIVGEGNLFIGSLSDYAFFNGLIDEVEIFNRALSQEEIQAIYNAGSAGKCKPELECVLPPDDMVSWYNGDSIFTGEPDIALDIWNGNDGEIFGGMEVVDSKVLHGFSFDGIDDYILVPDHSSLDVTSITIDAWIKRQNPDFDIIMTKGDPYDSSFEIDLNGEDGRLDCIIGTLNGGISASTEENPIYNIPLDVWTHFACTYDQESGSIELYINGEHASTSAINLPGSPMGSNNLEIIIGQNFNGLLDEVEIFNRALSETEILDIYLADSAGKCKPGEYYRVFVTSGLFDGDLGGLGGAKDKCQIVALSAGLSEGEEKWQAWLSGSTTSAADRLHHSEVPYRLLDGTKIADDWNDLTDGNLDSPININEYGEQQFGNVGVWTGTNPDGTSSQYNCNDWTSNSNSIVGDRGILSDSSSAWTNSIPFYCDYGERIYCFEQPVVELECGNGVINEGEECDDGNNMNNDGCSDECIVEFCGDGICQQGETCMEDCDVEFCFYEPIEYAQGDFCYKCPDVNFDGVVNEEDYNVLFDLVGEDVLCEGEEGYNPGYDLDNDGCIDIFLDGDFCIAPFYEQSLSEISTCCNCGNNIVEPQYGEQCDYGNDVPVCDGCVNCQIFVDECCDICCFGGYCCGDGQCSEAECGSCILDCGGGPNGEGGPADSICLP